MQDQLDRIEAKLDALIDALADEADEPAFDLEGNELPVEREPGQSLD